VKNTTIINCPVSPLLIGRRNNAETRNTNTLTACMHIRLLSHELTAAHNASVSKARAQFKGKAAEV
jgi:hypothetical protein